jgi:acetylornithine deacetylase/succinyl-diaminopimelate desuccinylase-like protein
MPEEDPDDVVGEFQAAVDRARARDPKLRCTVEFVRAYTPFANDPQDPWIQSVCALASHVRGAPVEAAALSGGTDVADVARLTHAKIAIHGVADFVETRNHAPDERCKISDMLNQVKIVAALVAGTY